MTDADADRPPVDAESTRTGEPVVPAAPMDVAPELFPARTDGDGVSWTADENREGGER